MTETRTPQRRLSRITQGVEIVKILITTEDRRSFAQNLVGNIQGQEKAGYLTEVIIQPHVEKKSDEQRGWFHFLCREISKDTGYTEGQVKELVKKYVLGTQIVTIGDQTKEVTCSSETDETGKARSKMSYSQLIDGAYQIGAEAGIALPNPMYREAG